MTKQLTPKQIKELRVFLADYGLNVTVKRPASKEWAPKTPAGAKCKARMAFWAKQQKVDWSPRKMSQFDIVAKLVRAAKRRLVDPRSWAYVREPSGLYVASIARTDIQQISN